jgi:hypothetical protein
MYLVSVNESAIEVTTDGSYLARHAARFERLFESLQSKAAHRVNKRVGGSLADFLRSLHSSACVPMLQRRQKITFGIERSTYTL